MLVGVDVLSSGEGGRTWKESDVRQWICAATLLTSYKALALTTALVPFFSRGWGLVSEGHGWNDIEEMRIITVDNKL